MRHAEAAASSHAERQQRRLQMRHVRQEELRTHRDSDAAIGQRKVAQRVQACGGEQQRAESQCFAACGMQVGKGEKGEDAL